MLEIIHLDERHADDLHKFFIKHKEFGGLQLIKDRNIFLTPTWGAAIACVEDRKTIKQVLVCEFKELSCFTKGMIGEFGDYSLNLLDGLCARCSSNTPMITEHKMVIHPAYVDSFKAVWPKTRLSKMALEENWLRNIFIASIEYPS